MNGDIELVNEENKDSSSENSKEVTSVSPIQTKSSKKSFKDYYQKAMLRVYYEDYPKKPISKKKTMRKKVHFSKPVIIDVESFKKYNEIFGTYKNIFVKGANKSIEKFTLCDCIRTLKTCSVF